MGGVRRDRGVGCERVRFRRRRDVARRRVGEGCVVNGVREQSRGGVAGDVGGRVVRYVMKGGDCDFRVSFCEDLGIGILVEV